VMPRVVIPLDPTTFTIVPSLCERSIDQIAVHTQPSNPWDLTPTPLPMGYR